MNLSEATVTLVVNVGTRDRPRVRVNDWASLLHEEPPPGLPQPEDSRTLLGRLAAADHAPWAGFVNGHYRSYVEFTWPVDRRIVARKRIGVTNDALAWRGAQVRRVRPRTAGRGARLERVPHDGRGQAGGGGRLLPRVLRARIRGSTSSTKAATPDGLRARPSRRFLVSSVKGRRRKSPCCASRESR